MSIDGEEAAALHKHVLKSLTQNRPHFHLIIFSSVQDHTAESQRTYVTEFRNKMKCNRKEFNSRARKSPTKSSKIETPL